MRRSLILLALAAGAALTTAAQAQTDPGHIYYLYSPRNGGGVAVECSSPDGPLLATSPANSTNTGNRSSQSWTG